MKKGKKLLKRLLVPGFIVGSIWLGICYADYRGWLNKGGIRKATIEDVNRIKQSYRDDFRTLLDLAKNHEWSEVANNDTLYWDVWFPNVKVPKGLVNGNETIFRELKDFQKSKFSEMSDQFPVFSTLKVLYYAFSNNAPNSMYF